MKKITIKDLDEIVDVCARENRYKPYFMRMSNSNDAYEYYVSSFKDDIRKILEVGECFRYKSNILLSINITELKKDNKEYYDNILYGLDSFVQWVEREVKPVIFIQSIINTEDELWTSSTIKMINTFIKQHGKCVIYTDTIDDKNEPIILRFCKCNPISISSLRYFVWR